MVDFKPIPQDTPTSGDNNTSVNVSLNHLKIMNTFITWIRSELLS